MVIQVSEQSPNDCRRNSRKTIVLASVRAPLEKILLGQMGGGKFC